MHPVVALVTAGVETDVRGLSYREYMDAARKVVIERIRAAISAV
jgi:hypothetical protein